MLLVEYRGGIDSIDADTHVTGDVDVIRTAERFFANARVWDEHGDL